MSDTSPDLTPEQVSPEPAPKKRIVRRARSAAEAPAKPQSVAEASGTEQDSFPAPRKRTVRKKVAELADDGVERADVPGKKTARKTVLKSRWKRRRMFLPGPGADVRARSLWRRSRKLTVPRLSPERMPPSNRCAGVLPRLLRRRTVLQQVPGRKFPFMRRLPSRLPILPILFRSSPQKAGRRLFARDL